MKNSTAVPSGAAANRRFTNCHPAAISLANPYHVKPPTVPSSLVESRVLSSRQKLSHRSPVIESDFALVSPGGTNKVNALSERQVEG